jgi:hypothetical protein
MALVLGTAVSLPHANPRLGAILLPVRPARPQRSHVRIFIKCTQPGECGLQVFSLRRSIFLRVLHFFWWCLVS